MAGARPGRLTLGAEISAAGARGKSPVRWPTLQGSENSVSDQLVLWDIDGTLLNADEVGRDLYDVVFVQLFGRSIEAFAPMAGHTDRAMILETLMAAGVSEPRRYVDPFIAGLTAQAPTVRSLDRGPGAGASGRLRRAPRTARARPPVGADRQHPAGGREQARRPRPAGRSRPVHRRVRRRPRGPRRAGPGRAKTGVRGAREVPIGLRRRGHRDHRRHAARHRGGAGSGARAVGVATGSYSVADLAAAGAHAVLPDLTNTDAVLQALRA